MLAIRGDRFQYTLLSEEPESGEGLDAPYDASRKTLATPTGFEGREMPAQ